MRGPMQVGRVHMVNNGGVFWIEFREGRAFSHQKFLVGTKQLPVPGEVVRFWLEADVLPGRTRAVCVHRDCDEMADDYSPELAPAQTETWKGTGTISEWNDLKGYGRIQPTGRDVTMVFSHMSTVQGVRPWVGASVEFEATYSLEPHPNWRTTKLTVTSQPSDMPQFIAEKRTRRVYTEEPVMAERGRADARREHRRKDRRRDRWDDE